MLVLTKVAGNIFKDGQFGPEEIASFERVRVSRPEMEKGRIRKHTTGGTEVGLAPDHPGTMRNGDVLTDGKNLVLLEQLPEKVISVRLDGDVADWALVGHIIGNRHRPISVGDGTVAFPIQADSELEVFKKLLAGVGGIEMSVAETVFAPHGAAGVHDHG